MQRREFFSGRLVFKTVAAYLCLSSPKELLGFRSLRCSANSVEGTSRSEIKRMWGLKKKV